MAIEIMNLPWAVKEMQRYTDQVAKHLLDSATSHACILWQDIVREKFFQRGLWLIDHKSYDHLKKYNAGTGGCEMSFRPFKQVLNHQYTPEYLKDLVKTYDDTKYFFLMEIVKVSEPHGGKTKMFLVPLAEDALFGAEGKDGFASFFRNQAIRECANAYRCSVCDKYTHQRCTRCKMAFYCSKPCQNADWKSHKKTCMPIEKVHNDNSFKNIIEHHRKYSISV